MYTLQCLTWVWRRTSSQKNSASLWSIYHGKFKFFPSILTDLTIRCFSQSHSLVICYKAYKSCQRGNISRGVSLLSAFLFYDSLCYMNSREIKWPVVLTDSWFLSSNLRGNTRLKGNGLERHCEHMLTSLILACRLFWKATFVFAPELTLKGTEKKRTQKYCWVSLSCNIGLQ